MATPTDAFTEHCLELLAVVGRPRAMRMFGGRGIYVDDLFMALIVGERLYLKTDDTSRAEFEAAGCEPFSYATRDGTRQLTSYWSAPEQAMDSPEQMRPWARLAMASALRAQAAKASARPRKPRTSQPRQKTSGRQRSSS